MMMVALCAAAPLPGSSCFLMLCAPKWKQPCWFDVRAALESWLLSWPDRPLGQNAIELLNLCRRWAGRRNDVAHGLVDMNADDARWYLFPSLYGTKGRKLMTNPVPGRPLLQKSGYRRSAEIIAAFSDEFLELHNQMNRVVSAMGNGIA
jgi:hypothetical protein